MPTSVSPAKFSGSVSSLPTLRTRVNTQNASATHATAYAMKMSGAP